MTAARKRGLGRGLDALLADRPDAAATAQQAGVREVAVDRLEPNRFQPRQQFNEAGLDELAESIRAQGVIQPLVVSPVGKNRFTIIAGERRWRAAQRAGVEKVPVVVRQVETDQELLELALVENLQRADLNAIEEAEAYRSLRESFSLSQTEIGQRVGKSRVTVTNALRLLRLPEEVQDLIRDGELSAGQARPLLSLDGPRQQSAMARKIVREQLSARAVEEQVAQPAAGSKKPKKKPVDVHTRAAAERLTRELQTKVEIKRRGERGRIEIHFHSEDELMRLYERLIEGDN